MDPVEEFQRQADALERAIEEVERRSRVCVEAARSGWGGDGEDPNGLSLKRTS